MGHARALISIEDPDVQEAIFKKAIKNEYSVRQIEKAVRALDKQEKKDDKEEQDTEEHRTFLNEISNRLRRTLSTKVNIKSKKNGGEIRIEYYSDDELERLIELFDSID